MKTYKETAIDYIDSNIKRNKIILQKDLIEYIALKTGGTTRQVYGSLCKESELYDIDFLKSRNLVYIILDQLALSVNKIG